jgi:hypothetical protein
MENNKANKKPFKSFEPECRLGFKLTHELFETIERAAVVLGISKSALCRFAVKEYLCQIWPEILEEGVEFVSLSRKSGESPEDSRK